MIAVSFEKTGEIAVLADDLGIGLPLRGSRDKVHLKPSVPSPTELLEDGVDLSSGELHAVLIAAWIANRKLFSLLANTPNKGHNGDDLSQAFVRATEALAAEGKEAVELKNDESVEFYMRAGGERQGAERQFLKKLGSITGPPVMSIEVGSKVEWGGPMTGFRVTLTPEAEWLTQYPDPRAFLGTLFPSKD